MKNKIIKINQIIKSRKYLQNKGIILDFLKGREIKYYFLNKLPKKFDDLQKIEFLLEEIVKDKRPFKLFDIFKESISKKNNQFIISFIQKHYQELEERLGDNMFQEESLRIVQKIIEQYPAIADDAFNLVKQILRLRGEEYKEFETKRTHSEEKQLISELLDKIFSIYKEQKNNAKIEEIIRLIDKHFNLVGDDGDFTMYTPDNIFRILKDYIKIDFENHFKEITNLVIKHYLQQWKNKKGESIYTGWELMGGVTSFWGHDYKVPDRHFVRFTLIPALEEYYKENEKSAWKFIIDNCISKTEAVNKDRPDFLNRVAIPILLKRYKNEDAKIFREAFKILKEFILSRKGIPHKSDLIYQEIRKDFPEDKKWRLVKISIDRYKLPINPFVEQIALELAKRGNEEAKEIIKGWIKNPDYYQKGKIFEDNIVGIISRFLEFSFNEGVEMFKDFISQKHFIQKFDAFFTFEVAGVLNKILNRNFEVGLGILNDLAKKKELSDNEQIVLCSSLTRKGDSTQENEEILMKIYSEFLNLFLKGLDNDIKKIETKITRPQSREAIVEFADVLAKHKKVPEAMRIIKVFVDDSDPCTPGEVDPKDPEGKYDEHKRIEQGEDTHAITTVKGWCAWVLMKCSVLGGRDYIEEIINLTEKLTQDKNYYVQLMSYHTLSQLARNRLAVMPENKEELFFNKNKEKALKMAKRIENIAFHLLEEFSKLEPKSRDVLMNALLKVFDHMKSLSQEDAVKLMKTIAKCGDKVIGEAAPLFIYYAEIRKRRRDFKKWKWQMPGLYDDLEAFDDKKFKDILIRIIKRGCSEINSHFAWHFWKLAKESVPDKADIKNVVKYSEAFEISSRYLNILTDNYDHQTFKNIYYFIQENIDQRFKESYELWRKCLKKEREYIEEKYPIKILKKQNVYEMSWWPFFYNGEILKTIADRKEYQKFLNSLEFLLDYPKEINIGDINETIESLPNLPDKYNQQVEKIFDKLITRNPAFYDVKEAWKKTKKKD